jgi:hypothetical protein
MAENKTNLALGYGTPAYDDYTDAQQNLRDMLAKRENRLFDPTLLAMAQGFFAPTKTGSFGESLGNVAGAVAPVQQAEDKRTMDLAKMRLDVAQQGLQTDIGIRKQQGLADFLNKNTVGDAAVAPAAPAFPPSAQAGASVMPQAGVSAPSQLPAAPLTAPPAGALPSVTAEPVVGALPAPVAPAQAQAQPPAQPPAQAPAQAGFSGGYPIGMPGSQPADAKGYNFNKREADYFRLGIASDKAPTDLIKDINEQRSKDTVWKEGYGVHIPSNTVYPIPSAEQVEIQLPDEKAPRRVFKSDSIALQHYAATNDKRYRDVLQRMKFGPTFAQEPTTPTAVGAPPTAPVAAPTTTDVSVEKARAEAEATQEGTGTGKRSSEAKDKYTQAIESKGSAESVKELIAQPFADLAVGVFEKPTVKAALLGMVNSGVFDEDKFRDAYTKINIKYNIPRKLGEKTSEYEQRKQDVYDRGAQIASQAAYLQFQTSLLAKGQGAISNNERQLFANTTLGVKDSVNTMNKKADMIIERANFAQNLANTLTQKKISLDQFRLTPEYKKMEKAYEDNLRNIWNPNRAKQSQGSGAPDLEAARRRLMEKT